MANYKTTLGGAHALIGQANLSGGANAELYVDVTGQDYDAFLVYFDIENTSAVKVHPSINRNTTAADYNRAEIKNATAYTASNTLGTLCVNSSDTAQQDRVVGFMVVQRLDSDRTHINLQAGGMKVAISYNSSIEFDSTDALTEIGFKMASSTLKTTSKMTVYGVKSY